MYIETVQSCTREKCKVYGGCFFQPWTFSLSVSEQTTTFIFVFKEEEKEKEIDND